MSQGKLILLVGPSGSGKGALLAHIKAEFPQLFFPVSWTTRKPRAGEEEGISHSGKAYHFVTREEFEAKIDGGGFLEWAQYGENLYGTPEDEIRRALKEGKYILQELEIQGARQLRQKIPADSLYIIFVDAGSWDELRGRILERSEMSEEELRLREERFKEETEFVPEAHVTVYNKQGKLDEAKEHISKIIKSLLV